MSQGVSSEDLVGRTFSLLSQGSGYGLERPWASVQPTGLPLSLRAKPQFCPRVRSSGAGAQPAIPCVTSGELSCLYALVSICETGT